MAELLVSEGAGLLFFAGCSDEQRDLPFDYRVLLTTPRPLLVERLRTRTSNPYGHDPTDLDQILIDLDEIEPLLRRSADLVLETTVPVQELADRLLASVADHA